jgi:sigma-B regulation protein RsbU (phosphoserine phosphatase)
VCGHGLSSALLCDAYVSQVKALAPVVSDPAELLRRANELLVDRLGLTGLFVTSLLVRQQVSGEIEVASAGHPAPIVVEPGGQLRTVDATGPPLGVVSAARYRSQRSHEMSGTVVVMFSDGVTETRSPGGEFFGSGRLEKVVAGAVAAGGSCDDIHREVVTALESFRAGLDPEDDATLVVTRRRT